MANSQSSYFFLGIPVFPLQKQTVPIPVLSGAHDHFQTSSKEILGEQITFTFCYRLHSNIPVYCSGGYIQINRIILSPRYSEIIFPSNF